MMAQRLGAAFVCSYIGVLLLRCPGCVVCLCSAWRGGRPPLHQPPTALQPPHKRAVRAILSGARTCLLSSLTAPGSLTRFAPIFRSLEYLFGGVVALAAVHKRLPRSAKKVDIGGEGGAAVARRFDGSATMRAARKANAFKRTYVADARIDYSHRMDIWMRGLNAIACKPRQ